MKIINSVYAIILSTVVVPLTALAQIGGFGYTNPGMGINQFTTGGFGGGFTGSGNWQTRAPQFTNFNSLLGLAHQLLGYFQVVIFVLAILFALWGALLIVIKGNFAEGRPYLLYAFVGVVIAILSFSIIPLACFFTQASGPACSFGYIL